MDSAGNVKKPLGAQDGGASPHPEVPGFRGKRTGRRVVVPVPVLAVILALLLPVILALAAAVAVLSARRCEESPAAVLACPEGWVGYREVCYYLSEKEGSWERGQEQCSSLGASLAVAKREWELEFLSRLKGNVDYWLGLRRQGERLEWVDGSSFNHTIPVQGQGPCLFLNDHGLGTSSCSQLRPYLCSKPQARMFQG
ncbi:C-type lectin domain family 2 member B-like isoform 1-T3 [Phoenicopterus ruber ruber]